MEVFFIKASTFYLNFLQIQDIVNQRAQVFLIVFYQTK